MAAIVAAFVLAFPAFAVAQQSGQDAYKPQGQIEEDVGGDQGGVGGSPGAGGGVGGESGSSAPAANASESGLPFTGMDVALLAGAGALLLGAGVGMRRLAHRQDLA